VIDRPKEPPKLDDDDDEFGSAFPSERPTTPLGEPTSEERPSDERPTVSPPFDFEEYAKQSESKMMPGKSLSPENVEPSTKPPPALDFDPAEELVYDDIPRSPQITLTNEGETEEARIRSVLMHSDPPPLNRKGSASGSDDPPATRAYPSEYEKDPFAHLVARSFGDDLERRLDEMGDRFSLGDYTGALEIADGILTRDPANAAANQCAEECREKLIQMYTARVGPLDRVPVVTVAREQLRWLSIDHRAGFLLSHIDGVSSLEMILDVSGMPLLDALKILAELSQQRVISFR
jgi:hypothetical protein